MTHVPELLGQWCRLSGPASLLRQARHKIEAGSLRPGSALLAGADPAQRMQIGQLLGLEWERSGQPVRTDRLRQALDKHGITLEGLLEVIGGPLRDLPAEREAAATERARDADAAQDIVRTLLPPVPRTAEDDVARVIERCLVGAAKGQRTARAQALVGLCQAMDGEDAPALLAVFAARELRDAHGLDRSRALGRATARLLRLRLALSELGVATDRVDWADPVTSQESWREAWASAGIACDALSSQVLVLNLPLEGSAAAARFTDLAAGEPVWLTLRSLRGEVRLPETVREVYVCENPAIVETAADRLGQRCRPLVCTFGRPGVAAFRVFEILDAAAAEVYVRADGDEAGWDIYAGVRRRLSRGVPWRMPPGFTGFEEELIDELIDDLDASRQTT